MRQIIDFHKKSVFLFAAEQCRPGLRQWGHNSKEIEVKN